MGGFVRLGIVGSPSFFPESGSLLVCLSARILLAVMLAMVSERMPLLLNFEPQIWEMTLKTSRSQAGGRHRKVR